MHKNSSFSFIVCIINCVFWKTNPMVYSLVLLEKENVCDQMSMGNAELKVSFFRALKLL